jgi:hypothetical protein
VRSKGACPCGAATAAAFAKLKASYGASAEATLFTQLDKALKDRGTLDVLRCGLKIIPGIDIQSCAFRPASAKDPDLLARYEANTLSVIRQVHYSAALPEFDALFDALYSRFCDGAQRPAASACEFLGGPIISVEEIEDEPAKDFFDFNNAGPQSDTVDYEDLIAGGALRGERSEEFQRTVWHLAAQGKSEEEIAEELEQHPAGIGAKYSNRLLIEVQRSYGKWQQHRQAGATGGSATAPVGASWPQIRVVAGELPRVVAEAEAALLAYGCETLRHSIMLSWRLKPIGFGLRSILKTTSTFANFVPVSLVVKSCQAFHPAFATSHL